ncbi:hypothetical protein CLUG_00420 [Clavispora lusitaniae ATCC 42720]|uniref:Major facilitator superfamily (MFS) profile domain-containing protein n=1 Tax=Clavispora lusitaniae (strain ATCC 42720) TaxID=306902 RepID=C4XWU7_CLAL4|nr:uncharacterized protein CLUG_00420 [Clavispora lusitaniae ATCC 42720]EEQ36297.1 hypothetical protein CLUG_00420 [Clavispora lusitaniae ATCC 42720]
MKKKPLSINHHLHNMSQEDVTSGSTPINGSLLETEKKLEENLEHQMPEKSFKDYISISIFCLLVAFGGFVFGFDTGTISGFVNMPDFKKRFGQHKADGEHYLSNVRTGLIVSIFNVGCAVGGIFLSKIADVWGRRMGMMVAYGYLRRRYHCPNCISITLGTSTLLAVLYSGLAVGTISVVSPLFISEVSPKQIRGTLVCCFQLFITMGIFLGYCTTYGTKKYTDSKQWRVPLGLCFAWAIFLVVGMLSMPESPRYLIEKAKIDEARRSIARSNKLSEEDPAVHTEIQLIQAGIDREALAGKASWKELITGKPKIFRRVLMGVILQSLQQLTGNNYFFYYGTTIFKAVGYD